MATFSFASTAWCRPSLHRLPYIMRPVFGSTMCTLPPCTTYSTSFSYIEYARSSWLTQWMSSERAMNLSSARSFASCFSCADIDLSESISTNIVGRSGSTKASGFSGCTALRPFR